MKITSVCLLCKTGSVKINLNVNLLNKSWSCADEMSVSELLSILHTAIEFKEAVNDPKASEIKLPDLQRKSVTLLLRSNNEMLEAPFHSAARFLMVPVQTIVLPNWDKRDHVLDIRKVFEKHTDCLFCDSQYITKSHKIIYDSPIPVVFVQSCRCRIILGLAQIMTIYQKFGYLNGLNILWIGPPSSKLNTLLTFCQKLSINFNYCCGYNSSALASPSCIEDIKQQCAINFLAFKCTECTLGDLKVVANNADVIITTRQEGSSLKITEDFIRTMKPESIILHTLHRGASDLDEEIFQQENCLVWDMVSNMKWIYAALMVRLMSVYEHTSQHPKLNI